MGFIESKYDGWLDKHFIYAAENLTILELGCGFGDDTSFLSATGHNVISCDYAADKIEIIKEKYPGVITSQFDMRGSFPFDAATADIVIASLCLHFFEEADMRYILAEIKRVLKKSGKFLCRLNSEKGYVTGVAGETELGPGKYMTSEGLKQFYNEDRIRDVFKEWDIKSVEEYETEKYSRRKVLFEVIMESCP